jgi:hypothetical protein
LERGFLRNGDRHEYRRFIWGAISAGDRRGADIPGQFKSNWLLVPTRRTQPGHRHVRFRGEIFIGHRRTVAGCFAGSFRVALEFCRYGIHQSFLFCAVLCFLSKSERG